MAKKNNDFFRAPSNVIVDALKESANRVKELEAKVAKLEKELAKYKTQNREMRQREKSLRGQLSAARSQVSSLQKGLKIQKVKARKAVAAQKQAEAETARIKSVIKKIMPKMTKEEVFEMYRGSNLTRFWNRVEQVITFTDQEKLAEMKARMGKWSSQTLRDIIRLAGWRSTWYDSDAEWNSSELTRWDEEQLYVFIMSYQN